MAIYTKTGDNGETSLANGERVAKDSPRIEAYGTLDELSSHIGLLISLLNARSSFAGLQGKNPNAFLEHVQNILFEISSVLAGADIDINAHLQEGIQEMEHHIDTIQEELPPLRAFILPGGCQAGAQCHVCRTVCRRAERRIVNVPVPVNVKKYLNRLSDYLFVFARQINKKCGVEEKTWQNTCK